MTDEHVIYVVTGSCGRHEDSSDWFVAWRTDPESARQLATQCYEQLREIMASLSPRDGYVGAQALIDRHRPELLDARVEWDFGGTWYAVDAVSDDPMSRSTEPLLVTGVAGAQI